ncbi:hypothetical protein ACIPPR_36110 [Streptomyces nigra]|uniref:hypothetical protein n=1 Tax=Streptomyces nigra TaxID=1827580 RepID=UPI00381C8BCF
MTRTIASTSEIALAMRKRHTGLAYAHRHPVGYAYGNTIEHGDQRGAVWWSRPLAAGGRHRDRARGKPRSTTGPPPDPGRVGGQGVERAEEAGG